MRARIPDVCVLRRVREHVPFCAQKCSVDVFEGLTSLASPLQTLNSVRRAGARRPGKPTERCRTRPTAETRGERWTAVASPTPSTPGQAGRYHAGLGAASAQSA